MQAINQNNLIFDTINQVGKKILGFFIFLFIFIAFPVAVLAEGEFATAISTQYSITEDGKTTVSQTITLRNLFSTIHAVSYSFIIQGTSPENIKAKEKNQELPLEINNEGNKTTVIINFPNPVVGRDKVRTFLVTYEDLQVATKNGQVWEITVPKIDNISQYEEYQTTLIVPRNFGEPAYFSPTPVSKSASGENNLYNFTKEQLRNLGVVAAFGNFQVFEFELTYHLRNPLSSRGETEIALPPDNAFQRLFYTSIDPKPRTIRIDEDGNWLAKYLLSPQQTLAIKAAGSVQLFAKPQNFFPKTEKSLQKYLAPNKYWESDTQQIVELAQKLKTPREIYNFVTATLSYDYSRVQQDVERLGALLILSQPDRAICMEFTDLFIALSRAAGIPAREVNGYAYAENPKIQPLSLVADVLHAWPEYWDATRSIWVPVDPTWGNTTGGIDFFSKLDLSHFAFVAHGLNSQEPYPAGSYKLAENPQKDVSVFFGKLPTVKENFSAKILIKQQFLPFLPFTGVIKVENSGSTALYNTSISLSSTNGKISVQNNDIEFLPPFTTREINFSYYPSSFFNTGGRITAVVGNQEISYTMGNDFLVWRILEIFATLTFLTAIILVLIFLRRKKTVSNEIHNQEITRSRFKKITAVLRSIFLRK